ncbi:stage II sporulation protein M [Petroclostridium sp. X23]|uniref:stage II sporulation protein M n=1 Tax=Petroclostridium sp. X23 TaxID=3045146 RepID=UPI0024AD837F|nr:stage II sporulation protein M [Petroclostridium sp. X23]WHH58114.1 stage II sporulation protein M [Petroclostridium sp. X23]
MTEDRFIRRHSKTWKQLEELLSMLQKNKSDKTDFNTLKDLDRLYRQISAHLSYAQTYFPDSQAYQYLNTLVARGHNHFYTRKKGSLRSIAAFFLHDIPCAIISNSRFFIISCCIFLLAALFSFATTWIDGKNAYIFLPAQFIQNMNPEGAGSSGWDHPVMSGLIMSNNIYVSLLCFAYGISLGIGTIYILAKNGFLLGSLSAVAMKQGTALTYWSLILPHGIIELCAIFISGAAGLKIGWSLIRPGSYTRRDALMLAAKDALKLIGIVVVMLIVAGIIEGFFTPSSISPVSKLVFAACTGIFLIGYFLSGLRRLRN